MAQHDYVIANGTGAAVRSDLNNALAAIVSQNSGATAPSTTYAYQWWADTTTGLLKLRNAANNGWITLFQLDGEWSTIALENGSAAAPSIYFKDSGTDTGVYSPGTDQVAISTGGTGRLFVDSSGRVGLGTSTVDYALDVRGTNPRIQIKQSSSSDLSLFQIVDNSSNAFYIGADNSTGSNFSQGNYARLIYSAGAYPLRFSTNGTHAMTIDSSQRVGIGTTSPQELLHLSGSNWVRTQYSSTISSTSYTGYTGIQGNNYGAMSAGDLSIYANSSNNIALLADSGSGAIKFATGGNTERARIDNSGRLLIGTSTARSNFFNTTWASQIQLEGTSDQASALSLVASNNANEAGVLLLGNNRGSVGGNTVVQNGDVIGIISFQGNDGSQMVEGARIQAVINGAPGADDLPTALVFSTTADGASSPTERMRIGQNGAMYLQKTTNDFSTAGTFINANGQFNIVVSADDVLNLNRLSDDGKIIRFFQASVEEGNISVSGTTVSYNGAHLSRWSQLPGNAERTEILRGTVLSNIDEMCSWGDEENEQLNRMKVSDIEGDPNVAGVFQSWDDDDDTYTDDFYCAMTGDFIIRIAEGVAIQRGDLLMSAGDGTAKPQDDDIIRSKTVAKVTSVHVTCTYDDGSYCVPCVLMAC